MPDLSSRLQASLGRKFRIVRELTGGGMARVFLAEDTELQREVAIKVLTPQLGDAGVLQRFRNEVLQTTRLQHPTIVSVFDVGTIEGDGPQMPYYIMPYVRGESLRSRLKHDGTLSVNATLRILRSVLDALVYAHGHGVVHRDIKPENIFLSGTNAVLADFGIAKAISGPRRSASLTTPGTVVGTLPYMAPEQIAGDENIDTRADLYSVGIVAFEMLAGALPWDGKNAHAMFAAKVRGSHTPLLSLRGDVPEPLAALIEQCLAWEPAKRPQSAEEMLRLVESLPLSLTQTPGGPVAARSMRRPFWTAAKLLGAAGVVIALLALSVGWWKRAPQTAGHPAIRLAVLSQGLGPGPASDSTLGRQLYRQLVAGLYPVPGLELVNETDIARMSELGVPPEQVIEKQRSEGYDSALVLETRAGNNGDFQLRLVLLHMQSGGRYVFGNPITLRTLNLLSPDSVSVLVALLTQQVVSRFQLVSAVRDVRETKSSDAGLERDRGRVAVLARTPHAIREAIAHYERAIVLDPTYAQAHADLADAMALALFYRYRTGSEPYAEAATALGLAKRAIVLQPALAEGYTAQGYIGMVGGAPIEFVRLSYATAQKLNPENPSSRLWYVGLLALENRYAQALDTLTELTRLDPTSPSKRVSIALYSLPPRRYADVVANAAKARAAQPGFPFPSALQLWGLVLLGGERLAECVNVVAGPYLGARATCLERAQGRPAAQPVLDTLSEYAMNPEKADSLFDGSLYASEMAMHAAFHREWDSARLWMRRAFKESPLGIEPRFLRSGVFNDELIRLGDSLRAEAWKRVEEMARIKR